MSISGALSNALSGLTAASRSAEIVSENVANALTEGYGRRKIELAAQALGGNGAGVTVNGVVRQVNEPVIAERRLADAALGNADTTATFFGDLQRALGLPDDPASITGRIDKLEASLIEAASRPDSQARLQASVTAAKGLAGKINAASREIQDLRLSADRQISGLVDTLNTGLTRIEDLNHQIRIQLGSGSNAAALMDRRQQEIDRIAEIVPLKQVPREGGQVALYTNGGAILLDGHAATVGFVPVNTMVPQMTIGSGALSGISLNGVAVPEGAGGPLSGGRLSALFELRDGSAVEAQARLDAVARDLVERFADPTVDPTLAPGAPGLFTDAGAAFNAANETGLSGRISVSAIVDPALGGTLWHLRDGLGASTMGDVGNGSLLSALAGAIQKPRAPVSGGFSGAVKSASGLAGEMVSITNAAARNADSELAFAQASHDALKSSELASGVDTDQEMQQLLLVEQAYSANARVISTVDDMIKTLLGL